jgi:hypothetical protein
MSETSSAGLVDETGKKISTDEAVEPLVQYVQKHPVCTALAALAVGYTLGKIF